MRLCDRAVCGFVVCLTRAQPLWNNEVTLVDKRKSPRAPFAVPVTFVSKDGSGSIEGRTRDISLGGVFIETGAPAAFGTHVVLHLVLPGQTTRSSLPGVVRWHGDDGMGVQFGLLGAVETHAITEIVKADAADH